MDEFGLAASARTLLSLDRLVQFGAVGAVGAGVDTATLVTLHGAVGVPLLPAKLAGAEFAIVLMFCCNEYWTFEEWGERSLRALVRRLCTSNLVRLGGLATGTAVLLALTDLTGLWYPLANGVGLAAGFLVNYACESLLTWQVHRG